MAIKKNLICIMVDTGLMRKNEFKDSYNVFKKKYKFIKVYDLQNSKRTSFYKKVLFPKATSDIWSSTETTLPEGTSKIDFDKDTVLNRFEHQLNVSGIKTNHVTKPDFSWSCEDISEIKKKYNLKKYLILFPFSSSGVILPSTPIL